MKAFFALLNALPDDDKKAAIEVVKMWIVKFSATRKSADTSDVDVKVPSSSSSSSSSSTVDENDRKIQETEWKILKRKRYIWTTGLHRF